MKYTVVLESFEGPFDLLYHLIEKSEVDIYDIPISDIADQYINYLEKMEELDLDITSEFLVMAATLLEIKSKMLLPKEKNEGEQLEFEETDPREELVRRLIEYKKYKIAAEKLKEKELIHSKVFYKPKEEIEHFYESKDDILEGLELSDLVKALDKVIKKNKTSNENFNMKNIEREEITIEQAMNSILGLISENDKIEFDDLFINKVNRSNIVVTFLALLELIKLENITIVQTNNFGNIIIKKYDKDNI
ncbi:MAG: segregation/condensation protein A [Firmicutes bacterium]|nr:segregation/condensation protein A [Bacillota bacterium]